MTRLIKVLSLSLSLLTLSAQQNKVDSRNRYHRLVAVVPVVGTGNHADPFRPQYAPWPPGRPSKTGIIAYSHVLSDDKKLALVEFVALSPLAFRNILNDRAPQIRTFNRGQAKKDDIEKELRKYKKDFDINRFGMVMP